MRLYHFVLSKTFKISPAVLPILILPKNKYLAMYDHNQISNPSIFIETLCPGGLVVAQVTKLSYTHSKFLSSHILIFTGDSHKLESQKIYRQDLERSRSMHRTKSIN